MQLSLIPHPSTPPTASFDVWVDIQYSHLLGSSASGLFYFCVGRPLANFNIPPEGEPERVDELWKRTCFEAFLRRANDEQYREWNFAPSGEWAAYDFADYRQKNGDADVEFTPNIALSDNLGWWELGVSLPIGWGGEWQLGLSAVLEEKDGTKSYWALAHPPGDKPDFHARDCFVAKLA